MWTGWLKLSISPCKDGYLMQLAQSHICKVWSKGSQYDGESVQATEFPQFWAKSCHMWSNFFEAWDSHSRGYTQTKQAHFSKACGFIAKIFLTPLFLSLHLQNLGGVQANHKQDIFLLHHCFLSFSSYHTSFSSFHYSVFYCIFTEIIFFSPLLPNFYLI